MELYAAMAADPITQSPAIETHSFVDDSKVVGRETEISKMIDILTRSDNPGVLSVIPIVGMAGIGKTTLAQCVYNNEQVKRHFNVTIWVCVSDNFNVKRIVKAMVESLPGEKCSEEKLDAIVQTLKNKLDGKRYLLVLDDVWNEEVLKWDNLKDCFSRINANAGSFIIVTTRKHSVASIVGNLPRCHVKHLSEKYCWLIFEQRAFRHGGAPATPEFVSVGKQIVRKCGGVPLAIKVLGGMMRAKTKIDEWLSVQNSEIWNLQEESGILPALKLSFYDLQLPKKCFAYCSIFPKNFDIDKQSLIQLWMAQGLLVSQQRSSLTMEQVGDNYFNTLVLNSLLQDVKMDEYDNIISCKMHDLVHDLAQSVSKSDCLMAKANEINDISGLRHLSLTPTDEIMREKVNVTDQKLWTVFLTEYDPFDSLSRFKCLRILMVAHSIIEELPASIGDLKHLRYIDVSWTSIKTIPDSITELFHLQTLRLDCCVSLNGLPQGFNKLISLRHLYIDDNQKNRKWMPTKIGQLSSLQTLPFFVVDKGPQIAELQCLRNLRNELRIYGLEHVTGRQDAQQANISEKSGICSLKFHWSGGRKEENNHDEDVLEGLQPHPNLKGLKIQYYRGEEFPKWIMDNRMSVLKNLVKIELVHCSRSLQIPTLGRLPFLKVVTIKGMANVKRIGPEFYGNNIFAGTSSSSSNSSTFLLFPKLRKLYLSNMDSLTEWVEPVQTTMLPSSAGITAFPVLEDLSIWQCPQLTTIPAGQFSSIKSLSVGDIKAGLQLAEMSSKLTSLTSLIIKGIGLTHVLEQLLVNNKSLRYLSIESFVEDFSCSLNAIPFLGSLGQLSIHGCHQLTCIPDIGSFTSLQQMSIGACDRLTCLPSRMVLCSSLRVLRLQVCRALTSVPNLQELQSLRTLVLTNCGLTGWPEGLHCLTGLRELKIGGFSEELESFPCPDNAGDIQHLMSLQDLELWGWLKLKTLPEHFQHLPALKVLRIQKFDGLIKLPDWLANFSSLQRLFTENCNNLKYLPSTGAMQQLSKLKYFRILDCPLLAEACAKGSGPERYKIAHIPHVKIF